ncbi:TIGR02453 family protein [Lysobacteraceae bacterium NML75-0749]|nr:TIGR02453 family protein [Xanthomonadaceae bacterium NML75-0749]PJK05600.1 TIGR02453 family protein [Xanthomonadaceae bacterium NML91-0268]
MPPYFTQQSLAFLHKLAANNRREWFQAHKDDYQRHVREPFQQLLADLIVPLAAISPHFRADPKPVGGSLFRIYRDTRYASDKSPYKPWQGAQLFHERRRQVTAPAFYLHLEPGESFIGAGLWHPPTEVQRHIRQFIFENPESWARAAHAPTLRENFQSYSDDMLKRPPAGFPADFRFIDDLRQRSFVLSRALDDAQMTSADLLETVVHNLEQLAPFVDYLCAALDLEF